MTTAAKSAPNSNLIYLFALLATGAATGIMFVADNIIAYAAVVAIGAIVGMVVSKAGLGKATLAFLLAAVAAAVLYYFVIAGMLESGAKAVAAGEDAETRALAAAAGREAGNAVGVFVALIAFVQTFIPGFLGSAIGALVRPKHRVAPTGQPAMAR